MIDTIIKENIIGTLSRYLDRKKHRVFLFGSRATGSAFTWSDIDIGIEGETTIPGHIMQAMKGEIEESNIPYRVDLVDFSTVSKRFRDVARKNMVQLN